ncbi:MAG: SDR family oxidoreductase [Chloroflexi bacterium]|nr:SDR family oxidoreductase [Chloroflexota bacterium]
MGLFDGKLVIVTGGGSGIGRETALKFAAAGATVVISGRRQEPLDETVGIIEAAGGKAQALTLDLENGDSVASFAKSVLDQHGRVDVLVNNAGHSSKVRSINTVSQEEWDSVLAVNLTGVYQICKAIIPSMLEAGGGTIVTVSSMAALRPGLLGGAPYSAAKAAVTNLMGDINAEFSNQGIRATAVMPAEVNTPILKNRPLPPGEDARSTMMGPEDLADVIFLCAALPHRTTIEQVVMSPTVKRDVSADLEAAKTIGS